MTFRTKEANPIDKLVGNRVRMRRQMCHMSQSKLAEELGLTFQQIQKYEKGMNRIGGSRLVQIASVLGVTPAWFFEGYKQPGMPDDEAAKIDAFISSQDGLALAKSFMQIGRSKQRAVLALVEQIADGRMTLQ